MANGLFELTYNQHVKSIVSHIKTFPLPYYIPPSSEAYLIFKKDKLPIKNLLLLDIEVMLFGDNILASSSSINDPYIAAIIKTFHRNIHGPQWINPKDSYGPLSLFWSNTMRLTFVECLNSCYRNCHEIWCTLMFP